jgi:predicted amidophosphoribosyltransferase
VQGAVEEAGWGRTLSAEDGDFAARWKPKAQAAWRAALDMLFPAAGAGRRPRPLAGGFSAEAWTRIRFLDGPVCDGCGAPFEFDPGARCAACLARPRPSTPPAPPASTTRPPATRSCKLKHADRLDLAPMFARWLSRTGRAADRGGRRHRPVPLHPLRLLGRRYNQAAEIARRSQP